jgi:hypothetical protein
MHTDILLDVLLTVHRDVSVQQDQPDAGPHNTHKTYQPLYLQCLLMMSK